MLRRNQTRIARKYLCLKRFSLQLLKVLFAKPFHALWIEWHQRNLLSSCDMRSPLILMFLIIDGYIGFLGYFVAFFVCYFQLINFLNSIIIILKFFLNPFHALFSLSTVLLSIVAMTQSL